MNESLVHEHFVNSAQVSPSGGIKSLVPVFLSKSASRRTAAPIILVEQDVRCGTTYVADKFRRVSVSQHEV